MKYEVTGDTIIIKYIADGKYKQLELNKNDNIDLDFFGQLIKAKNNKQDAMCDLYAREVLSYDPSPERITTMSLTKVEEPSDYTKKQSAKLRIEELTRDLKVVEKEIEDITLSSKHKRIEDLTTDDLTNPDDEELKERLKKLKVRYLQIKDLIEKEERKYDTSKSEPLTHDQLLKKVSKEFENKISKVIGKSAEERKIMEDIANELTPKDDIDKEVKRLENLINKLETDIENKIEEIEEKEKDYDLFDEPISSNSELRDSVSKQEQSDKDETKEALSNLFDNPDFASKTSGKIDNKENLTYILKDEDIKTQISIIVDHIKIIKNILVQTNITQIIITTLKASIEDFREINSDNYERTVNDLKQTLKNIKQLNNEKKIAYTNETINDIIKKVNGVLLERERIKLIYDKPITTDFIERLIEIIPKGKIITYTNKQPKLTDNFEDIYKQAPKKLVLLWRDDNYIYSNKNLFKIFTKLDKIKLQKQIVSGWALSIRDLSYKKFGIFNNYTTTRETPLILVNSPKKMYLNIRKEKLLDDFEIDEKKYKITYNGFEITRSGMTRILSSIIDYSGEDEKEVSTGIFSGKIDLDRASTEEKLSEIIRLLQNIGYNLFTLTPNYEESERNKKLKSKGIDLREYLNKKKNNEK